MKPIRTPQDCVEWIREVAKGLNNEPVVLSVLVYYLEKDIAATPPASPWQTIDTAPRDGTKILAYTSERCGICSDPPNEFVCWWDTDLWMLGRTDKNKLVYAKHEPTHWMPLPEPPVESVGTSE